MTREIERNTPKPSRFRFAPVSGSPSTAVRMASGWFIFNGAVYGLLLIAAIIGTATGWGEFREARIDWLRLIASILSTVGMIWTGVLIWRCKRLGGMLALVFIVLQVLSSLLADPIEIFPIILMGLGVLVLLSVWEELR